MFALGLAIDTSISGANLCLTDLNRGSLLFRDHISGDRAGSGMLTELLHTGLDQSGATLDQLELILVSRGPGSFTGIKIGLAFAYGLQRAAGDRCRLFGTSALERMGESYAVEDAEFGGLFLAATKTRGAGYCLGEGKNAIKDVAVETLTWRNLNRKNVYIVGSWPMLECQAKDAGLAVIQVSYSDFHARLGAVMFEEMCGYWRGVHQAKCALPEPWYLRPSAAEENIASMSSRGVSL